MIGFAVVLVTTTRKIQNLSEKCGIHNSNQTKRLQIARPGSFEMHQTSGMTDGYRIYLKFVRTCMKAELIAIAKIAHDAGMSGNILLQFLHVPDVAHALLKATDKTRRETDKRHIQALEF